MEENGQLVQFIFNTEREVIAEQEENKWITYIRGSELLASSNDHARTYYHYATDEMGSITHIVDDRNILNEYEYDAWGNVVNQKETVKNRFKFNGQQLDPITQQYYLRARFYNPVIARFTQEDTYRGDGLNLYAYCRNNPIKYVDPTGNACEGNKLPEVVNIDPHKIRYSQTSVNGSGEIIESMKINGWNGDPIDIVMMPDGNYTTIDNTRVVAAREAGIDVQAVIHDYTELLPENFVDRFTTSKGVPTTWGDAISLRIGKQNSSFRNSYPNGSFDMKIIK